MYIIFCMFAFIMKKRVINILNKNKQRRTFKFLPEYEGGVVVYADDPVKYIKYDKKEKDREYNNISRNLKKNLKLKDKQQ